jgi:hypothetical protein
LDLLFPIICLRAFDSTAAAAIFSIRTFRPRAGDRSVGLRLSPGLGGSGALRPVAAVDLQYHEENDWDANVSVRAGFQFENPDFISRKLQILLEYYDGSSPNGQFYARDNVEYIGLGFHFFYD